MTKVLINRWNRVDVENYLRSFQVSAEDHEYTEHESFGKTSKGQTDLRGLSLDSKEFKNLTFTNCDFSKSSFLNCRFLDCIFTGCRFDKVKFDKTRDYRSVFSSCDFNQCKFKGYSFGYDATRYKKCSYNNCDFRGSAFNQPIFEHCDFDNCKMIGLDFNASSFEYVNFSSQLIDCWFRNGFWTETQRQHFGVAKDNTMKGVSFEKGTLWNVAFSGGCNLLGVTLPKSGNYLLVKNRQELKAYMEYNLSDQEHDTSMELSRFLVVNFRFLPEQCHDILNLDAIEHEYGQKVMNIILDFYK